jgi:hypothetical protein
VKRHICSPFRKRKYQVWSTHNYLCIKKFNKVLYEGINETRRKSLRRFTPTNEQIRYTVVCGDQKLCAFQYYTGPLDDCCKCCFTYSLNKTLNFLVESVSFKTLPVTKAYTPSAVYEWNASVPNNDRIVLTAENLSTTRKTSQTQLQFVNHKFHLGWPEICFRSERCKIYQSNGSSYKK